MSKPTPYFIRVYTPDPDEMDGDSQEDFNCSTLGTAEHYLGMFRNTGMRCGLMRRDNIAPYEIYGVTSGWDFDEVTVKDAHE
jgi:hypothetical protein